MTTGITIDENGLARCAKDPQAVLDYSLDFSDWLGTDTISTFDALVQGVTLDTGHTPNPSRSGAVVTAWLAGGTAGSTATCTYRVTTAAGRTDDRTIYLDVADR